MQRWTIEDAATLLATVTSQKHPTTISSVVSGWDMLQVDRPSFERLQEAIAVLVGSHLVVVDSAWRLRLTAEGGQKLLFSATLTRDPAKIAALGLRHPKYIVVQSPKTSAVSKEEGVLDFVMEKFTMPATLTV